MNDGSSNKNAQRLSNTLFMPVRKCPYSSYHYMGDGNKDCPFYCPCRISSGEGMPVLRFSFSGNGGSKDFRFHHFQGGGGFKSRVTAAQESGYRVIYAGTAWWSRGYLGGVSDDRIKFLISLAEWLIPKRFMIVSWGGNSRFGMYVGGTKLSAILCF